MPKHVPLLKFIWFCLCTLRLTESYFKMALEVSYVPSLRFIFLLTKTHETLPFKFISSKISLHIPALPFFLSCRFCCPKSGWGYTTSGVRATLDPSYFRPSWINFLAPPPGDRGNEAKQRLPAEVQAAGPADEPVEYSSIFHGFLVWPPNQMSS